MATVIPKQLKKQRDQITIRLDCEVLQTLDHYCRYLESGRDYVINQCLAFIFRKDKQFLMWLANQDISGPAASNGTNAEQVSAKLSNRKDKNGAIQGRLSIAE